MLHVNDDSNDEIFRKAANDYFLDAGNPDFNKFVSNADNAARPSAVETVITTPKKKRRNLLPAFDWAYNKITHSWPTSFLRIFRQHSWYGKAKKKINPCFIQLQLYCRYNNYCIGTII